MRQSEWEKYCDDVYRDAVLAGQSDRGAQILVESAKIAAVEVEVTDDPYREWVN